MVIAYTQRLEGRVVLGGLGVNVNGGLPLPIGNGEVFIPVLWS